MTRTRTSAALAALLLTVAGCGPPGEAGPSENDTSGEVPVNVRTLQLARTDLREYLTISGPLSPARGTVVSTEETGVVESYPHDKGSYVDAGDVVVLLNRELLEAEVRAAEAGRDLAVYNEERTQKLRDAKQVSEQELRRIETELEDALARLDAARIRWERAAIKAPFAGIVADRYVEPGQHVGAGTPVGRVVDPFTLKVDGAVSEREVRRIQTGAAAAVAVEGVAEVRRGRVSWVSFEADPMSGKFQVEVHVDNRDLALRPGVVARAQIVEAVHEDVLVVPRDAIVLRPEGPTVFAVEDDRARAKILGLGADQGLMVVVRAGLAAGESIVVRGQRELHDGSLVSVREQATSPDGSTESDPDVVKAHEAFLPFDLEDEARVETSLADDAEGVR